MADLAIHSKRVILENETTDATLFISKGIIIDIVDGTPQNYPGELIEAGNNVVMAGIIDTHVHINEPGRTEWEGFETATRAAIAGGITTLIEMPLNASPVTTTAKAFDKKVAAAQNKLYTNCGFWGGIVPGNANEIEKLIDKGVFGFKAFLTHSGIDDFPNVSEDDLRKAMPIIARHQLPLLVHCELKSELLDVSNDKKKKENNNTSYKNYLASRPKKSEDDAIALMIKLCEEYNCPVHIVHLSSSDSIEQISRAKQKGLPLTVETAQHYLFFNAEEILDGATQFKCAPPIRAKENNELLWRALKDGIIDFVATDHSPATPSLKEIESGNFMKAWGGIASLQFALPALWTAAKKRNCSVVDIAKWLCANPAKLIGAQNNKGTLAKGYDADIVIWSDEKAFAITEEIIRHRHKITPYLNTTLYGSTEQTYLAGMKVFDKEEIINGPLGRVLTRNTNT
ncbi:MAG: allantoinase AllB [Bacteroidota bacterium]|nr:allantoinase AllB [Bacteroidota bacterium]